MAGLRHGRPNCIRAAFSSTSASATPRAGLQKRQWSVLRRVKASHIKNFVEGIRREFLDPSDGEADDAPGPLRGASGVLHASRTRGAEGTSEESTRPKCPELGSAGGSPEVADVDMQPVDACGPDPRGWAAWPSGSPVDTGLGQQWGPCGAGRQGQPRARVSPRASRPLKLGPDKDKGLKLARDKRKLELLLAEPERRKRKKARAV